MNENGNYIMCFRRTATWGMVLLTPVHFPNFLAVIHISVVNKYLLKEGRNFCAAAVVCVYAFWPYAAYHLLRQCGVGRWA